MEFNVSASYGPFVGPLRWLGIIYFLHLPIGCVPPDKLFEQSFRDDWMLIAAIVTGTRLKGILAGGSACNIFCITREVVILEKAEHGRGMLESLIENVSIRLGK